MFRGASGISIDPKGRLAVPARYREVLVDRCQGQLVATVDPFNPCLLLYPLPEWEGLESKLITFSDFDPTERAMKNILLGHARELEMDNAGRVLLPPELRGHAHLDKKAMLVGQLNKFQIWDDEQWQKHTAATLDQWRSGTLPMSERLKSLSL
ncbi:MAG: division/cell wall cluster transcriptional repressor MraZ [Gammaproteobacteria bacterium]|nr:division/cell wall cluster transcriptional repressor MraZ [Gammaproteobacteria bacterium]